jgi:hypothetical protein
MANTNNRPDQQGNNETKYNNDGGNAQALTLRFSDIEQWTLYNGARTIGLINKRMIVLKPNSGFPVQAFTLEFFLGFSELLLFSITLLFASEVCCGISIKDEQIMYRSPLNIFCLSSVYSIGFSYLF